MIVLDTNVVVSAFVWGGTPKSLIDFIIQHSIVILCSNELLIELEKTLQKPKLEKYIALTGNTPEEIVATYRQLVSVIEPALLPPDIVRDRDDVKVLAVAVAGKASIIVSGDQDLLTLGTYDDIPILKVAPALEKLSGQSTSE